MQQTPNDLFNFVEEPLNIKVGDVSTVWKFCHNNHTLVVYIVQSEIVATTMNTADMGSSH